MKPLLVSFMLLFFGASCFSGELYTAEEKNLPDWARQGKFHFLRVDGGPIEKQKAILSGWPLSEESLDVLGNLYDEHAEQMIGNLKKANINWIWITWSNGFSLKEEAEQRRQCRRFIKLCHKEGIKVTAYLSGVNMFWHNMFLDEPQSITWVNIKDGKPTIYGRCPNRFCANVNNPEWREYVKKRVQLAFEADIDALFFDNLEPNIEAMITFFSEVQEMAEAYAKKTGRDKPLLLSNFHVYRYEMGVNDICDAIYNEDSLLTPGVKNKHAMISYPEEKYQKLVFENGDINWWVDNIRKTKYVLGDIPAWKPHFHDIDEYSLNDTPGNIFTPKEEKLSIAEATAFGIELARCLEGSFIKGLIKKEKRALEAWEAMSEYNGFTRENEQLYINAQPVSHVLVISNPVYAPPRASDIMDAYLQDMLSRASVQYDICLVKRLEKLQKAKKYQAVIVSPLIELTSENLTYLQAKLAQNGKIFVSDKQKKLGDNFITYTSEQMQAIRNQWVSQSFLDKLASVASADAIDIEQPYVLASLMEVDGLNARVLHVLNYADKSVDKVTVEITGLSKQPSGEVSLLSPDKSTKLLSSKTTKDSLKIKIQNLDTYAVVVIGNK